MSINNQLKLIDGQLVDKRELLAQTNQDLEEGQTDRHTKYRELKRRDETMSAFMETFAENMEQEKRGWLTRKYLYRCYFFFLFLFTAIDVLKNQITYGIEQITLQGINLKSYGTTSTALLDEKHDLGSQEGLLREYKRLSIQLKQLQILHKRTSDQVGELEREEQQYEAEVAKFGNHSVSVQLFYDLYFCFEVIENCIRKNSKFLKNWWILFK